MNECGICLGEWTNPVKLPCGHSFCADCLSGWKPKFGRRRPNGNQRKRCPLCRGTIPPSQEQISEMKAIKLLMENTSHPDYEEKARWVKQFEAEHGEDWDGTIIEYDDDFLNLPRLLLSWGAEIYHHGDRVNKEVMLSFCHEMSAAGYVEIANLVSSELGGRRCEIVSAPNNRDDLVGKTCVVEEYVEISDQYKVKMEFMNEVLLLDSDNLKRRDRTPQDSGYYVESKNNRLIRRDFKSNEECRAFIASLGVGVGELSKVNPDTEAKAEQAAADLLAELGLEDLEGPSSSASKKNQPASSGGKKKKRVGKKKGRK
ncbi:hypothetical protein THAOC_13718 [Thalassiosira oceanica]|uniref:RING-type domain-containing protein n=1 Tax=Thalassiosira oceanica TaxID=159749 RepID=K0SWQ6_THAOC|nr:hypothetical protein THAOC_13718 [Thalassiosira oceanica]|eukprot:EJK65421.1 hypothetical protein THAOC_13718 [Thalassiosira oceanica]